MTPWKTLVTRDTLYRVVEAGHMTHGYTVGTVGPVYCMNLSQSVSTEAKIQFRPSTQYWDCDGGCQHFTVYGRADSTTVRLYPPPPP